MNKQNKVFIVVMCSGGDNTGVTVIGLWRDCCAGRGGTMKY